MPKTSRLSASLATLRAQNQKALVAFFTAGFPDAARCREILFGLPDAGADVIELGMPFTDPMADGPAIQAANNIALSHGHKMHDTLVLVREFRARHPNVPLVLMGYANPIFFYGIEKFMADAATAGADGLIIVDVPPEEDTAWQAAAQKNKLDMVRLVTPTANPKRIQQITAHASGFLYYVTITGITGAGSAAAQHVAEHMAAIRRESALPVMAGFGIKTAAQAAALAAHADGVVVGSALIERAERPEEVLKFVTELKAALGTGN